MEKKPIHIENTVFVVIDFETTGLSVKYGDDICEVAAVRLLNGEITDKYSKLVNPGCPISPGASAVNNITDDMVKSAPRFKEICEEFLSFIGTGVIVGHHLPFDMSFLNAKLSQLRKPLLENDTLDTLRLARKTWPHLPSFKLPDLRRQFSIEIKDEHRALGDVVATAALLCKILENYKEKGKKEI
ncbi:MAG: 3'-5' exonuclease [Candidatus Firestonebacteria bacterium]|nr:3'-5' exonuclease [Candidatus Firestonebacteria bacterium]